MHNVTIPQQGDDVSRDGGELAFKQALHAAVDYRGDITLVLLGGENVVGYVFSLDALGLDLYLKDSPEKRRVMLGEIEKVSFTGRDTAQS